MRKVLKIGVVCLLIFGVGIFLGFVNRVKIRDLIFEFQKEDLPEAVAYRAFVGLVGESAGREAGGASQQAAEEEGAQDAQGESAAADTAKANKETIWQAKQSQPSLPESINLAVPFTSQAPYGNWDLPYKETCEEASLLMVARYKKGESISSPQDADQGMLQLIEFQNEYFGDFENTTAEQTAEIARVYYGFEDTEVLYDFTLSDIKKELAIGNPVIVPASGRQLPNPYFRSPLYHMVVIRGYTEDSFITNDPGTKRGEGFIYKYDDLLDAVHDWNGGDVENGRKAMIVVK